MKDICIIPTHERPEFLWLTLEKIGEATDRENIVFWVCEDIHSKKSEQLQRDILAAIDYGRKLSLDIRHCQVMHDSHGSSYNVLTSFRKACETAAEFIFFIEDDVRITKDFFRFCYAAQEKFDPFFVTGNCAPNVVSQVAKSVFLSDTWVQTFAMCFQRTKLKQMLKPGFEDYGVAPTSEWDNYLLRYTQETGQFGVCACLQRGYHFGFHSYHAGKSMLTGDLTERVSQTRAILANPHSAGLERNAFVVSQIAVQFPAQEPQWVELSRAGSSVRPKNIRIPMLPLNQK